MAPEPGRVKSANEGGLDEGLLRSRSPLESRPEAWIAKTLTQGKSVSSVVGSPTIQTEASGSEASRSGSKPGSFAASENSEQGNASPGVVRTILMNPPIPLEDNFEDLIAKSMRGLHLSETELAERTRVPRDVLSRLCRGEFCDEAALVKVARALSLDPRTLAMSASRVWRPRPVSVEGLEVFNLPYRDMRVNAFLVWDPAVKAAAFFDTGTDSVPLVERAGELGVSVGSIFLTHTHNDHVAALERLRAAFPGARVLSNRAEPWPGTETFAEGAAFAIGSLGVTTRTTSGHSAGGTTYLVEGLSRPLALVGDAIFAGSMGGGMVSFKEAWKNNREKILTLPEETVLCPGHGPLTTVGEEKRNNPFFSAEFAA